MKFLYFLPYMCKKNVTFANINTNKKRVCTVN